jgi:thiamine biosynthesis lipoprotein
LRSLFLGSWLAVLVPGPSAASGTERLVRYEKSRVSMACTYTIIAYGPAQPGLTCILDAALDEVDRIDRLMSHYKPESPLSQLNREAAQGPVRVEPELFDFIAECLRYSRDSEGAFDVTVGPLMKAWGFFRGEGRVPGDQEISELRSRVGNQRLTLDPTRRTIQFDRPGVELDLGGIAKGYAVDRAVSVLKGRQIAAALVSAGGSTLYGLGTPPGLDGWEVGIQDPLEATKVVHTARLKDRALSVAGTSEKSFELGGVTYSHIMDPRTGRPVRDPLSVAVLAESGTAGDALDDALFVLGLDRSREYLKRLPRTEAFFFFRRGTKRLAIVHLRN